MATEATFAELVARIKADTSQLDRALADLPGKAKKSATKMDQAFKQASQAIGTYFSLRYFKGIIDAVDHINDLSIRLGVSTEAISNFGYAAKLTGTTIDTVSQGLVFLGNNVSDAAAGIGTAKDALASLGLNAKELTALTLDKQFERIAEAIAKVPNSNDRIALMRDIFGKMGVELLPMALQFKELRAEAEALGYTVSDETAQRFAQLNDEIDRLSLGSEALGRNLLSYVVPGINDVVTGLNELLALAPNTSNFFNSLGATFAWAGAKVGLVDQDVADAAAEIAGENIATGESKRKITPRTFSGGGAGNRQGAATKATKDLTQAQKDAARITDLTRTAQERYDTEITNASALLQAHAIDQDTFSRYQQKMQDELDKSSDRVEVFAINVKDYLGDAFESALFDAENFSDGISKILDGIARKIARQSFIDPLADAASGIINRSIGSFDLGNLFGGFRAGGGPVSGGKSYMVGEQGPEIFTPNVSGGITPNHAMGGKSVQVNQIFNVSPGIQGTVEAEIRRAAPAIAAAARDAVYADIERGGTGARLVGRRT